MEACMAAAPVGVMQLLGCPFDVPGAWSVSSADWRSFVLNVGVPCLLAVSGVWSLLRLIQQQTLLLYEHTTHNLQALLVPTLILGQVYVHITAQQLDCTHPREQVTP